MSIDDILEPEDEQVEQTQEETQKEAATEEAAVEETTEKTTEEASEEKPEPMAPLGALHEERGKRRELESQVKQLQSSLETFSGLKDELSEYKSRQDRMAKSVSEESEQALLEQDPIAYLTKQVTDLKQQNEAFAQQQTEAKELTQTEQAEQTKLSDMMADVTIQVAEYTKEHPDYPDAYQFIMSRRMSDLQTLGITDPRAVQQALDQEAIGLSKQALNAGRNPAEVVHDLAKSWGYTAKSQEDSTALDEQMDRLEKGQQAATTNKGGGKKTENDISLQEIDDMSDDDLDKLFDEMQRSS